MTDDQIRHLFSLGARPSELAPLAGRTLPAIHHLLYGWGPNGPSPQRARRCAYCRLPTMVRITSLPMCVDCKTASQHARTHAGLAVRKAVRIGALQPVKSLACVDCGDPAVHYEHRDYSRPLDVQPVCKGCNIRRGPAKIPATLTPYRFAA